MKIRGTKTSYVEFDVHEEDVLKACVEIIQDRTGLKYGWVNDKGILMEEIEGPHGSWDTERGPATELQKLGYETITRMKDIFYRRTGK